MRDPKRIRPYCEAVATIWESVPDWRFSQLMINAMLAYHNKYGHDAFYVEDKDFIKFLNDFIREATGNA